MLAIIPVRAGSKRIPDKNTRDFCGKPLIMRCIDIVSQAECVEEIIVTSDCPVVEDIVYIKYRNAKKPITFYTRPDILAQDNSRTEDALRDVMMREAVSPRPAVTKFVCVQATSPLILPEDVDRAVVVHREECNDITRSVHPVPAKAEWMYTMSPPFALVAKHAYGRITPVIKDEKCRMVQSQSLPQYYSLNGAVTVWSVAALNGVPTIPRIGGFIIPPERAVDIDTEDDWIKAEELWETRNK